MTPFPSGQTAARALLKAALDNETTLNHRSGQFIGGLAFGDLDSLSEKQNHWIGKLLQKADLPPLEGGVA